MHTQFIYINTYKHTMHIIHPCIYVMIGRTKNAVHYTHVCMHTYRSKYTQKCAGNRVYMYNPKYIHVSLAFRSSMYEGDFELNHARIICFRIIVESLQTHLIFFIHSQKTLCNIKRINRQATRSFSHVSCCNRCILTEGRTDKNQPGKNLPDKRPPDKTPRTKNQGTIESEFIQGAFVRGFCTRPTKNR